MLLFYILSFFKKGDTIQGGTLFKGRHYLRKYGISNILHTFTILTLVSSIKTLKQEYADALLQRLLLSKPIAAPQEADELRKHKKRKGVYISPTSYLSNGKVASNPSFAEFKWPILLRPTFWIDMLILFCKRNCQSLEYILLE